MTSHDSMVFGVGLKFSCLSLWKFDVHVVGACVVEGET
jgi:hypothetical protein